MEEGHDLSGIFARLVKASKLIEKVVPFAKDDKLGYLTSCPTNIGTGMRASVHVTLPYLGQDQEQLKLMLNRYNLQMRGVHGEHSESPDHVYDISNKQRLGKGEAELLEEWYRGIQIILNKE
jgi:arginine kinase